MGLTYYDDVMGEMRLKRRYKWAILAFLIGNVTGVALTKVF